MTLMAALRDPDVAAEAARVVSDSADNMRGEVLRYIDCVEAAARAEDFAGIYDHAHEIRGLAGNAGLAATARIANGLCRYLDALDRAERTPEGAVVALHLDAISRAAHAEDEATRLGDAVANELAQLVEKKLAEINDPATR
jgi:HPt (histidine-containing phosphotransfer) domain-containing protein